MASRLVGEQLAQLLAKPHRERASIRANLDPREAYNMVPGTTTKAVRPPCWSGGATCFTLCVQWGVRLTKGSRWSLNGTSPTSGTWRGTGSTGRNSSRLWPMARSWVNFSDESGEDHWYALGATGTLRLYGLHVQGERQRLVTAWNAGRKLRKPTSAGKALGATDGDKETDHPEVCFGSRRRQWHDRHRRELEGAVERRIREGSALTLRQVAARARLRPVTIRLPTEDIDAARQPDRPERHRIPNLHQNALARSPAARVPQAVRRCPGIQ